MFIPRFPWSSHFGLSTASRFELRKFTSVPGLSLAAWWEPPVAGKGGGSRKLEQSEVYRLTARCVYACRVSRNRRACVLSMCPVRGSLFSHGCRIVQTGVCNNDICCQIWYSVDPNGYTWIQTLSFKVWLATKIISQTLPEKVFESIQGGGPQYCVLIYKPNELWIYPV